VRGARIVGLSRGRVDIRRAVLTRARRGRKVAAPFNRSHQQEVTMETVITSASAALLSRFTKAFGY
jgi:hypothetical protein